MNHKQALPVNEEKVIDKTIDVYLYMCGDLNTAEVIRLGEHLINLANRRATDVELEYFRRRELFDSAMAFVEEPDYNRPEDLPYWGKE